MYSKIYRNRKSVQLVAIGDRNFRLPVVWGYIDKREKDKLVKMDARARRQIARVRRHT
jgi:hypothetical protein